MENKRKIRAVEVMKDILIVLLTASALYLAAQTPLVAPLREEGRQTAPGHSQGVNRMEGALPMAMVVNLPGQSGMPAGAGLPEGAEGVRCGILYNQEPPLPPDTNGSGFR